MITTPSERHAQMLDELGQAVVSGRFPAGHVLTLDEITTTYAASRSVAREAVRVLESMGLLSSRRRVGITVQPRERWRVFDPQLIRWRLEVGDRSAQLVSLSELRRGFEPAAAALAAERADDEQVRTLAAAVADMAVTGRRGELSAYLEADVTFHRTVLAASRNEMLLALGSVVEELLTGRTHHDLMPHRPNPEAIDLHEQVARAIRDGDAAAAEQAMRAIIDEAALAVTREHGS